MKLKRFIRKEKLQSPVTSAGYEYLSRLKRIFNDRQENDLAEHIKALCDQYYGLSVVKCRCLAYEFATKNNVTMPDNWVRDGKAGVEWIHDVVQEQTWISNPSTRGNILGTRDSV